MYSKFRTQSTVSRKSNHNLRRALAAPHTRPADAVEVDGAVHASVLPQAAAHQS